MTGKHLHTNTGAVEKSLELPWKRRAICMAALGPSFESSLQVNSSMMTAQCFLHTYLEQGAEFAHSNL